MLRLKIILRKSRLTLIWCILCLVCLYALPLAIPAAELPSVVEASGTRTLGSLNVGDKVVDPTWQWQFRTGNNYSGGGVTKPVTWIVVAKNHSGYPAGSVTLLTEKQIGEFTFDDSLFTDTVYHQPRVGYAHWGYSGRGISATRGLRPWLNSTAPHASEGFFQAFSDSFRSNIMITTLINRQVLPPYGYYYTEDAVFIPSSRELGDPGKSTNYYHIGQPFAYFLPESDNNPKRHTRIAGVTHGDAVYWTRTPYFSGGETTSENCMRPVNNNSFSWTRSASSSSGVRPAINMRAETPVSTTTNAEGAYNIVPPAAPDLVIESFTVHPSGTVLGQDKHVFTVIIKNEGTAPANNFWVDFYEHQFSRPSAYTWGSDQVHVSSLAPGATEDINFAVQPDTAGLYFAWVQVDTMSSNPAVAGPLHYIVIPNRPRLTINSTNPDSGVTVSMVARLGQGPPQTGQVVTPFNNTVTYGTMIGLSAPEYIGEGPSRKIFENWSGDVESNQREIYFVMDANKTVTANYVNDPALVTPPAAPTLSSPENNTTMGGASVTFSWNSRIEADKYFLEVHSGYPFPSNGSGSLFYDEVGNSTSRTVSGLPNDGSTLYWRVWAGNDSGWSPPSLVSSFVNGTIPSQPGLSTPAAGSHLAGTAGDFTWGPVTGANKYWLEVNLNTNFNPLGRIFYADVGNVTTRRVSGLPNDVSTVYWRVWAGNNTGWSPPSATRSFTSGISVPLLVNPAHNAQRGDASVAFSWNSVVGANNYFLEVNSSSDFTAAGRLFYEEVGNSTGRTVSGLLNDGTRYHWRVWAGNDSGWSPPSASRSFVNGTMPSTPSLSTPAAGSHLAGTAGDFTWGTVTGANKYFLEVNRTADFSNAGRLFYADVGNVTSRRVSGLPNDGSTLYWRAWAGSNLGWSPASAGRSFTSGISAPGLENPAHNAQRGDASVVFSWNNVTGADKYFLEVNSSSTFTQAGRLFYEEVGNSTSRTVSGLPNDGTRYHWRVWAGNDSGWSPPSASRSFVNGTRPSAPGLSTPAAGSHLAGTAGDFTWGPVTGANKYWLEVNRTSNFSSAGRIFYADVGNVTTRRVSGLPNDGSTLYWRAWAGNNLGWSPASAGRSFTSGISAPGLVNPAHNAHRGGASVAFSWNSVVGANKYFLEVNSSSTFTAAGRLFYEEVGNSTSRTVSGLPNDGTRFYLRVWAGNNSGWSPPSVSRSFVNGS